MANQGCRPETEYFVGKPGKNDPINYQPGKQELYSANAPVVMPAGRDQAPREV